MNNEIRLSIENAIINQSNISQIIDESIGKEGANRLYEEAKSKLKPRNNTTDSSGYENSNTIA